MNDAIELGDVVECKVSGHRGIVVCIGRHLTGCDRAEVRPPVDKDGKMRDAYYIDVGCLKVITKQKVKLNEVQEKGPTARKGGPPMKVPNGGL